MSNIENYEEGVVHHLPPEDQLREKLDAARIETIEEPDPKEGEDFFHLSPEQEAKERIEAIEYALAGNDLSEAERNDLIVEKNNLETALYQNKEAA